MPLQPTERAKLFKVTAQDPDPQTPVVTVQFNPTTLSYSIQNTLRPPDRNPRPAQFVAQASAKLEFDVVFDSTHDGHDVRADSSKVKSLMIAGQQATPEAAAPPVVIFRWGAFSFRGYVESMRESLDFFSENGVPLRSSVKVSMTAQDTSAIFTQEAFDKTASGMNPGDVQLVSVPPGGTQQLGTQGGNTGAGRGIAAANGLESIRNPGVGLVAVASGSVQLKAAAAFSAGAGAGAGFGAGAGAGFGASAGAGFGAGASAGAGFGASAGASAGFGASAGLTSGAGLGAGVGASFGGASSAGVSASAGAFAGLGASKTASSFSLDTSAFQARATTNAVSTDFAVGGRAVVGTSGGLNANVGASARLKFD